jgi:hypothetical protein
MMLRGRLQGEERHGKQMNSLPALKRSLVYLPDLAGALAGAV